MKKLLCCIMIGLLCTSCINLKQKVAAQHKYMLQVSPPTTTLSSTGKTLQITYPEIAPQFASYAFIYRTKNAEYLTDYYHGFLTSPTDQMQQLIQQYLEDTNLFRHTTLGDIPIQTDYILHTRITELYADYSNPNNPAAVISIRFTYIKSPHNILFTHTFSEKIHLQHKDSVNLIHAWNIGLQKIFQKMASRLKMVS